MYGKCIVADYNSVHKDKCAKEFLKLKDCYLVGASRAKLQKQTSMVDFYFTFVLIWAVFSSSERLQATRLNPQGCLAAAFSPPCKRSCCGYGLPQRKSWFSIHTSWQGYSYILYTISLFNAIYPMTCL